MSAFRPTMSAIRPTIAPARLALRRTAPRHFQSTASSSTSASDAAAKARQMTAMASQGLSRASAVAGPYVSCMLRKLSSVGGRTARVVNFIERQTPFVVYYSRVGLELSRLVFKNQKLTPPTMAAFETSFNNVWKNVKNPYLIYQKITMCAHNFRYLSWSQLANAGVVVIELLGFFTVGEMIGRFKLVGYHGGSAGAAHH